MSPPQGTIVICILSFLIPSGCGISLIQASNVVIVLISLNRDCNMWLLDHHITKNVYIYIIRRTDSNTRSNWVSRFIWRRRRRMVNDRITRSSLLTKLELLWDLMQDINQWRGLIMKVKNMVKDAMVDNFASRGL